MAALLAVLPEGAAHAPAVDDVPSRSVPQDSASTPAVADAMRVMALGDSITGSPGCWRAILSQDLRNAGHGSVRFVGSQSPQGCEVAPDGPHEGHSGIRVTRVAAAGMVLDWVGATNPDLVLMHYGTNDILGGLETDEILDAYSTVVHQLRMANPDVMLVVAQIIPINRGDCATCVEGVAALNIAIPAWADSLSTEQSPIVVVDQWSNFDPLEDTHDGVHPNNRGEHKIAKNWLPAVSSLLAPRGSEEKHAWHREEDV
ncbi:hypothetical protein J4H86_12385 [Spiractinospora alimapuensis]|uniref:SGNH/GDSL hydrolase family protein n=1 Tax=Spiractinospora alimapuensis TaxID=2820884 RepID=UPI001F373D4C|nr:SGNH/GDSL hydrolase family protein [Spiractinospora alimapuensis]QVQ54398.1 hypothetical protein J4H86_12385 [Spiractinospora alimapuensis]